MRGFSGGPSGQVSNWARTGHAAIRCFSHFGGVRILLTSGAKGKIAKEEIAPGGLASLADLGSSTGSQEIVRIRKMVTLIVRNGGKAYHAS